MNFKERRDRLFKRGRPHFRKADLMNLDGSYGPDMGILWAAYKHGSFQAPEGMTQEQFADWIIAQAKNFTSVWIGEDDNKHLKGGRGPVGVVSITQNDLLVLASGQPFKWALKRNVLKLAVGFLHMITLSAKTGVCMVKVDKKSQGIADHMKKYGLLHFVGKTGQDEFLYSIRGRGS